MRENKPGVWALTHAKVYIEPGSILDDATILIRDGLIENVGRDIRIPKDATALDMSGKTIYPGFIDSWVEISAQSEKITPHDAHWNHKVNARLNLSSQYQPKKKKIESLHKIGFTTAHIVPDSGIFQGQTALVQLNNEGTVLKSGVGQDIAYEVDGWGSDDYPNSLLGVIALLRQTFLDANWYGKAIEKTSQFPQDNPPIKNNKDLDILSSWIHENRPFIFETNHELSTLRSFNVSDEFQLNSWIRGSGYEYRRISTIAKSNPFIILPLDFPTTPEIGRASCRERV